RRATINHSNKDNNNNTILPVDNNDNRRNKNRSATINIQEYMKQNEHNNELLKKQSIRYSYDIMVLKSKIQKYDDIINNKDNTIKQLNDNINEIRINNNKDMTINN